MKQYSMETVLCMKTVLLVLICVKETHSAQQIGYLVEGLPLTYSSQINVSSFDLIIEINYNLPIIEKFSTDIQDVLSKWSDYPAFKSDKKLAQSYFSLLQRGIKNLKEAHTYLVQTLDFVKIPTNNTIGDGCIYKVSGLSQEDLTNTIKNLVFAYERMSPLWTPTAIRDDPAKDNTLRLFSNTFDDESLNLEGESSKILSYLDLLVSGVFPESLQGLYQSAICIGKKNNEKFVVKNCQGYPNMFICNIEVREPSSLKQATHLIPVVYGGVQLMGYSDKHVFIRPYVGSRIKQLDCEEVFSNINTIQLCNIQDWSNACESAVTAMNKDLVNKHCNFTIDRFFNTGTRVSGEGVLVQGSGITTRLRQGTAVSTISTTTPLVVYSISEILIDEHSETIVFSGSKNSTREEVLTSFLDESDIAALRRVFYFNQFFEAFGKTDILDIILFLLQVVSMPISIAGLTLAIKDLRLSRRKERKNRRNNYSLNRELMRRSSSRN